MPRVLIPKCACADVHFEVSLSLVDPLRILLVDDNEFDRELAAAALQELRATGAPPVIMCAGEWRDAKPLLTMADIDLILLDYNLPGLSGLDILRELAGTQHPPVVMLTGQDDIGTAVETLRAGAYDYVTKSIDWGRVLSCAVERVLARVRLERQLAEAHARLAAYAGELEHKVVVRTAVVRRQAARIEQLYLAAEQAARVKAEIVANVSHELRTPLNVILGYTEILSEDLSERGPSEILSKVREQAVHLRTLVESLLALDRLNQGLEEITPASLQLSALVAEVRAEADALNSDRGLILAWSIIPADREIVHDHEKIRAIAYHLVSNAIKFTPEGHVEVTLTVQDDGGLTISVRDTGVGLPAHARSKAFEEFRQLDGSSTRTHAGLGLGLGIVRRYTELLRGRITIDDRVGGGTTVTVALPALESAAGADSIPAKGARRG
jgi:signal transduction histidine kinase